MDAAQCAVEIQHVVKAKNAVIPEARRMEFRIGINLGDVIEEEDRTYGDGVNIASRIEGLADAGGICVSSSAYEQIRSKLALDYEDMGEHSVKNISWPVRVYRIPVEPSGVSRSSKHEAVSVTKRPSIAVLPFDNMSDDPEQEYFSDGMAEEIIARLSMLALIPVIARNSTFVYKGRSVKIKQIGEELGARYIVEGSVRKAGNMVRITAQLIDAVTENHLWARTYDREFRGIFALQDEIAHEIAVSVDAEGFTAEISRIRRIPTENLTAYDSWLQGLSHMARYTEEENTKAQRAFERSLELDPEFAGAHALLGGAYLEAYDIAGKKDPRALELVLAAARKAISLDSSLPLAYLLLAVVYREKGQYERAISQAERAISLNPNGSLAYLCMGTILNRVGRGEEAVAAIRKSMYLNPHYTANYSTDLAEAYRALGRHAEAIASLRDAVDRNPDWMASYLSLAQIHQDTGQYDEAIATLKEALSQDPESVELHCNLAASYRMAWAMTQDQDPSMLDLALEMAEKAVAIDDSSPQGHSELSNVLLQKAEHSRALAEAETAVDLAPDNGDSYAQLAGALILGGRADEAIEMMNRAMQLNPTIPAWYLNTLGFAYLSSGRQDEALTALRGVFDRDPPHEASLRGHLGLVILYTESGQEENARVEATRILELVPGFSVEIWGQKDRMEESDMDALRQAGLE